MSPGERVSEAGAPRALGHAQGRRWQYRRGFAATVQRPFRRRALDRAIRRDLARHFPHFAERLDGLARASGSPRDVLHTALRHFAGGVVAAQWRDSGIAGAFEVRTDPSSRSALPRVWTVRDLTAAGGYRTLSAAPAWLPAGLAGINERGLAGVALHFESPSRSGAGSAASHDCEQAVLAPAWLLLDQCLERCDSVAKAIDWCAVRPGSGTVQLAFVDASGAQMGIAMEGPARRRADPAALRRPQLAEVGRGPQFALEPAARRISLTRSDSTAQIFSFE